ncbi:MAG: glycosyltransferase family 4 protein [Fusicatenibacter sp.]|nr:glycosyltransferase family 4 protein [Lachnospiraceae bacterium]MDY2939113.1 glycosyltransferase family 4 protein [Fusicatenibacter sp.]
MKICFITYDVNQVGGIERVIAILSRYFTETFSWNVDILSLYSEETSAFFTLSEKVRVIHGKRNGLKEGKKFVKEYLLRSGNSYDYIFTFHLYLAQLMAVLMPRLAKSVKWIATEHNSVYYYTWKRKLLNLLMYRKADRLVVLTEECASYYRKHGIKNTAVLPNAVSFEIPEQSRLDQKRIVAVGRMERVKGYDLLLEAFAQIAGQYPGWKLRLIGDGVTRESLEKQAKELGIADRTEFAGYQKNVKEQLLEASFLVMPSRNGYEGFPMTALEALECGVPIVAFEMFQLREMAGTSDSMAFVEYGNVPELAKAMGDLMERREKLTAMGKEAKKRAAYYHSSHIGEMWKELLLGI